MGKSIEQKRRDARVPSVVDVANLAGVSIGTVSRVLNNAAHPVNPDTRARVIEAAAALDFTPNALARGLSGGRTRTIGVIVHDITDAFFNEIVRGIDDVAGEEDYLVMIASSYRDPEKELTYVRRLRAQRCDGIIFVGGGLQVPDYLSKLDAQLHGIAAAGGAVVMLAPHDLGWPSVTPDSDGGIAELADHLIGLGHRRFALMTGPTLLKTSSDRARSFHDALARHGIALDPDLVVSGEFERDLARQALFDLLARGKSFTALVCLNDQMAVGALQAARHREIRVPDDIAISGFDDLPVTELLDPPLTTVHVPMRELGRLGMRMVLARLRNEDARVPGKVPCQLVVRGSTGPAAHRLKEVHPWN